MYVSGERQRRPLVVSGFYDKIFSGPNSGQHSADTDQTRTHVLGVIFTPGSDQGPKITAIKSEWVMRSLVTPELVRIITEGVQIIIPLTAIKLEVELLTIITNHKI